MLSNLKILDFSRLLPGTFTTLMLADLGADVLHVQRPTNERTRLVDHYLNRSKKSITIDLKKGNSVNKIKTLVNKYDIVLEHFRPGVMERLGLSYAELKKVNPQIIYCSLTGFGQTGPYKYRPGHDINYLSISGLASYSGTKENGPAKNSTQIADLAGGSLHAAVAMLSAYIHRGKTGEGQHLDISMTDCAMTLNAIAAPHYLVQGKQLAPEAMLLNGGSFYDYYETKDGRYFSVGSLEPQFRKLLCEAIGQEAKYELSMSEDPKNINAFKGIIKEAFLSKTFAEWKRIFESVESCVEPVLTFEEVTQHPQIKAREMIVNVPNVNGENEEQIACPIKSNIFTPKYKHVGVQAGYHNKKILGD